MNKIKYLQRLSERMTGTWWFYLLLSILFFIPSYASKGYDMQNTSPFIQEILSKALLYDFPVLFPITKIFTILLIFAVFLFGDKKFIQIIFSSYVSVLYLFIAAFQHTAITEKYGFGIIIGNVILVIIMALLWIWEIISGENDFTEKNVAWWKLLALPLALFAFYYPVNPETLSPDFAIKNLIFNESAVTYCMITPVILTILLIYYPNVNKSVFRVTSYVGIVFGIMNMLTWFVFLTRYWWMGIMHLPLILISLICFLVSLSKTPQNF